MASATTLSRRWDVLFRAGSKAVTWEILLASLVLAGTSGAIAYASLDVYPAYGQLIVGSLAWHDDFKYRDYALLVVFVIGFFAWYLGTGALSALVGFRHGVNAAKDYRRVLGFSVVPAAIWLGGLVVTRNTNLDFLFISAGLAVLVIVFSIAALARTDPALGDAFADHLGTSVVIAVLAPLGGAGIALALARLYPDWQMHWEIDGRRLTSILVAGTATIAIVTLLAIWLYPARVLGSLRGRLRTALVATQVPLPLFFLAVLPPPWTDANGTFHGYPITTSVLALIGLLAGASYIDLAIRGGHRRGTGGVSALSALSPLSLVAILLFLKLKPVGLPTISPDDYHIGEFLLPWWLSQTFGQIPFWDYAPARGLVNYAPGLVASTFFDGTAATFGAAWAVLAAIYLTLGFLAVHQSVGALPAFVVFLLLPLANGIEKQAIAIVITAALCILCNYFNKARPSLWLTTWGFSGVALVLFTPGTGALFVVATLPLGLVALSRAVRSEPRRLAYFVGVGTLVLAPLVFLTPLGQMIVGAVRYGLEHASVNTLAHGIPWAHSAGSITHTNPLLWEFVRTSWIVVAIIAGVLGLRAFADTQWPGRARLISFAVPIGILMALSIFYAAGRIDAGGVSRLGITSMWALGGLLPILLFVAYDLRRWALVLVASGFMAGLIFPFSGSSFSAVSLHAMLGRPALRLSAPTNLVDGDQIGLPNLGKAIVDPAQLTRLRHIKATLVSLLDPGETYLDLTNRNANYFYLGRKVPIDTGAVYNLPTEAQQLRAVRQLEKNPPPVVLVSADTIKHDGGPASLRAHLIYRYVINRYIPVPVNDHIYLVAPDRVDRVEQTEEPLRGANLSNSNWANGIYTGGRAAFVVDRAEDIARIAGLRPGDTVVFQGSGARTVKLVNEFFDETFYLLNNPDVATAVAAGAFGGSAYAHFIAFGADEGRDPSAGNIVWLHGSPLDPLADGYPNSIEARPSASDGEEARLALLGSAFREPWLKKLPISWGRSFDGLLPSLRSVATVSGLITPSVHAVEPIEDDVYRVLGRDPWIAFDLSSLNLAGRDAGILAFDFACRGGTGDPTLKVYWSGDDMAGPSDQTALRFAGGQGRLVVPLDSAPRWLLLRRVRQLRFDVEPAAACATFRIRNVRLFQRTAVDRMP